MNMTTETLGDQLRTESTLKVAAGGSMMEAIGALATIALAIVGLAGVFSSTMASIATIIVGAAILIEGGSVGASSWALSRSSSASTTKTQTAVGGGLGAQTLWGVAGIVLGILALLGVSQLTLLSVAVLVFGASFMLGSFASAQAWQGSEAVTASTGG